MTTEAGKQLLAQIIVEDGEDAEWVFPLDPEAAIVAIEAEAVAAERTRIEATILRVRGTYELNPTAVIALNRVLRSLAPQKASEHRVIPAMRNGVLRHPPTCVNCDQPVEFPGSEWQHVAPSEP